jgi:hypothetical protein
MVLHSPVAPFVTHQQIHCQPQHTLPDPFQRPSTYYSQPNFNNFGNILRRLAFALASYLPLLSFLFSQSSRFFIWFGVKNQLTTGKGKEDELRQLACRCPSCSLCCGASAPPSQPTTRRSLTYILGTVYKLVLDSVQVSLLCAKYKYNNTWGMDYLTILTPKQNVDI